jgi:hypothetical protein
MDKVHKPSNYECCTESSKPFRFCRMRIVRDRSTKSWQGKLGKGFCINLRLLWSQYKQRWLSLRSEEVSDHRRSHLWSSERRGSSLKCGRLPSGNRWRRGVWNRGILQAFSFWQGRLWTVLISSVISSWTHAQVCWSFGEPHSLYLQCTKYVLHEECRFLGCGAVWV